MSGLVGLWNLDGRPLEEGILSKLSATLAHRGPDGEGVWQQGSVGLACQLFKVTPEAAQETQPLVHHSGAVVVFDGRLDNRDELLRDLKGSPNLTPQSPDPVLVLAAYETFGEAFPERLNGDFALGLFDPRRRQLLLARDAIGLRPLYYCRTGDTFIFGSEIKAILAHPQVTPRPNDDMVAEFLTQKFSVDNRGETFFAGVTGLLPGRLAIISPQGLVTRQHWDFDTQGRIRLKSFEEYTEAFRHHFEEAVRRRLRSAYPVAVSVSGGLDSSSIFCQGETLRRQNPERYPAVLGLSNIFPDGSPADEKAFLEEIEGLYGTTIARVPTGPLTLAARPATEIWQVEVPFLGWDADHQMQRAARQQGARVLLSGFFGDETLVNYPYLIDLFRGFKWVRVWSHLKALNRSLDEDDTTTYTRLFLEDLVRYHIPESLFSWLRRLRHTLTPSVWDQPWHTEGVRQRSLRSLTRKRCHNRKFVSVHAEAIYKDLRSPYNAIRFELWQKSAAINGLELACPFLDRDFLSFMLQSPGEICTWTGMQKGILRAAMGGILPEGIRNRRGKADFTALGNEGVEKDYPRIVHCLESGGMAARFGYVKEKEMREGLKRLKDRIHGPTFVTARTLSYLFGLELWLQVFFANQFKGKEVAGNERAH
ncbi:MAG: asparagine synthase-related protein [Desulfobaccales bacterium]|nr:asparagine synthase-related protein [Desulfobaccales bacterium]